MDAATITAIARLIARMDHEGLIPAGFAGELTLGMHDVSWRHLDHESWTVADAELGDRLAEELGQEIVRLEAVRV